MEEEHEENEIFTVAMVQLLTQPAGEDSYWLYGCQSHPSAARITSVQPGSRVGSKCPPQLWHLPLAPGFSGPSEAELGSRVQVYLLYTLDSTHRAKEHQTKKQSLVLCYKCGGFVCSHNICVDHTALQHSVPLPQPTAEIRGMHCLLWF